MVNRFTLVIFILTCIQYMNCWVNSFIIFNPALFLFSSFLYLTLRLKKMQFVWKFLTFLWLIIFIFERKTFIPEKFRVIFVTSFANFSKLVADDDKKFGIIKYCWKPDYTTWPWRPSSLNFETWSAILVKTLVFVGWSKEAAKPSNASNFLTSSDVTSFFEILTRLVIRDYQRGYCSILLYTFI